ncbi:outer membrane assembly lipoprotein YfiO [compost metagenome]
MSDEENEKKAVEDEIKEFKKRIPVTKIQLIASKRKQEEAAFRIARIYKLRFKDEEKANASFREFLEDFPRSSYEPEVLYYLALAAENPLESAYAARLLKDYPNTSFGRQIRKGTVAMTRDREVQALELYKNAYRLYDEGKLAEAVTLLEEGMNEYVGSQVEDKMALLRIFALGKEGARDEYYIALSDFVRSYPSSDLLPKAREMLAILN